MRREEQIQKYADELAQQYFPDECNIWARRNIEAEFVSEACMRMAKHIEQELIEKACEWISQSYTSGILDWKNCDSIINDFRKAMEE
jgi:tRNA(Ile)-lysidine synthase TilS/MesJ